MDWQSTWDDPLATYLAHVHDLIGDHRTRITFTETVKGIIAAGSLVCQRIAAHSPVFAPVQNGAQRVLRMATGEVRSARSCMPTTLRPSSVRTRLSTLLPHQRMNCG